ncbi:hypothetical protein KW803_03480 [Candidatus Saccharibacteria bacterium]|nr:hypothetical protein [Candidatus Saccharibacteria bacterium]
MASVERKLQDLRPWSAAVRRTVHYRLCLMGHESMMEPVPYKAENGGTRYVEGNGHSNASGGYQFLDSTWMTMLRLAEAYFGEEISNTTHAADAPAWAQDAVASFAIEEYDASDWTWSDCG